MQSGSKPADGVAEERWRTSPLWGDVTPPAEAPAPVKREKAKRELRHQRKHQVAVNGTVLDQWAEPRLSFDGDGGREQPFADTQSERKTMADRLAEAGLHRVTGAPLAHTGATCGGCVHFRLKPRLGGELTNPGAVGGTGQPLMGMLVCDWAGPITRSLTFPRTSAGEPACVHHEPRHGGEVILPVMRPVACRSPRCDEPVVWCKTGKGRMQVNAEPVDNGNIEVVRWEGSTPVIAVHGPDYEWPEGVDRYVAHFVTCPDAESFRKRGGGQRDDRAASHTCHADDCKVKVPPAKFMCTRHWFSLPKAMRDELWAAYVPGQEERMDPTAEYLAVAQRCIDYVASKEGRAKGAGA